MFAPYHTAFQEDESHKFSTNDRLQGHIYFFMSTVPVEYIYWFSPPPKKNITVTGNSRTEIFDRFREAVKNSNLLLASTLVVEIHCSGYFDQAMNILIELIGSHVHIHNPNICSMLAERYKKLKEHLGIPARKGCTEFPESTEEIKEFHNRPEIKAYDSTINCQPVRNFVIEAVSLVCLSHQKEMTLPRISPSDLNVDQLCQHAKKYRVGGVNPMHFAKKNELFLALNIVEKLLLFKNPKTEDAIYWILWVERFSRKCRKKGEKLPCKQMKIENVPPSESDHWVWYVWRCIFRRVNFCLFFKKVQISNIYYLFRVNFTKTLAICRLPLIFFAIRLLKYDVGNSFPSVINHLNLYVQACANVNTLYRNLQIRLAKKSWKDVLGKNDKNSFPQKKKEEEEIEKPIKKTKKQIMKEKEEITAQTKTFYLDIIPKKMD
jgi:hypothetical protein